MGRYRLSAYTPATSARFIVLWDLEWRLIDARRLAPLSDLRAAMAARFEQLAGEGWQAEGGADYGFVFVCRGAERRLLTLTPMDPCGEQAQSFNPFR